MVVVGCDVVCVFVDTQAGNVFMYLYDIIIRLVRDGWKNVLLFRVFVRFWVVSGRPRTLPVGHILLFGRRVARLVMRVHGHVPSHIHYYMEVKKYA